jgi:predicted PurR-regulated permease PerM
MTKYPVYIKATAILLMISLLYLVLTYARSIVVPISLAMLLSILLNPIGNFLETKLHFNRILANFIILILVFSFIAGLIYLLSSQIISFVNHVPELQSQVDKKMMYIQGFIHDKSGMEPERQIEWLKEHLTTSLANSGSFIETTLLSTTGIILTFGIVQFYIFFFLYYRDKFKKFIFRIIPHESHGRTSTIISETRSVIQSYITGVFTVVIILSVLVSGGLMSLGIPFAIFLGVTTALLNIIPYIGIFISALFAVTIAFLTKDSLWYVAGTMGLYLFTHLLESNILTPNIVGHRVSVNPLATFLALLIGSEVWGIMGMILFIPFVGILKVFLDNTPSLRPYGFLLGTEGTEELSVKMGSNWIKMRKFFRLRKHTE